MSTRGRLLDKTRQEKRERRLRKRLRAGQEGRARADDAPPANGVAPMRLTAAEREQRDEDRHRRQVQAEVDAFADGKEAGQKGLAAGLCPDYPSSGERRAWLDGWRSTIAKQRVA